MIYLQRETAAKSSAIIGYVEEGEEKKLPSPAIRVACRKRANEARTLLTRPGMREIPLVDALAIPPRYLAHVVSAQGHRMDHSRLRLDLPRDDSGL